MIYYLILCTITRLNLCHRRLGPNQAWNKRMCVGEWLEAYKLHILLARRRLCHGRERRHGRPRIGFPGWCVLAGVSNTMCATTASMVVVFPSDLWGHVSAGVGMLRMVRSPWCRRSDAMWHRVLGSARSNQLAIVFFPRMTLVGTRS
jgi:hypothetical protein